MRKNAVGLIWLAGIVLAIAVYRIGPDDILYGTVQAIEGAREQLRLLLAAFAVDTYDLMRAATLGLLPVFVGLGLLAQRRGHRIGRPVVIVVALTLLLLYQPAHEGWYISSTRWTVAFIVVACGCAVMTRRVLGHADDWPPAASRWSRPPA